MSKDAYEILGLEPNASEADIKKMYYKLSKKYHPDVNINDPDLLKWSEARMKELNQAYELLQDPIRRAMYNRQRGYNQPQPPPVKPRPVVAQAQDTFITYGAAIGSIVFAMLGGRAGILVGLIAALMGAMIGAYIGARSITWVRFGMIFGGLLGLLLGLFIRAPLPGLLLGIVLGAFVGWSMQRN